MAIYTYFDSPAYYENLHNYSDVGSSPYLLDQLIRHLDEQKHKLQTVYVAFYLFNNRVLQDKLAGLAQSGIEINVITIPIDGYDDTNEKEIKVLKTQKSLGFATKYKLAKNVFADYYRTKLPNLNLALFPHQYIRSKRARKFSKGELPYSMHVKSILAINKDGSGFVGLSSSNFAVRDLIKEEYLVIFKDEMPILSNAAKFFEYLKKVSIPVKEFDFKKNYGAYSFPLSEMTTHPQFGFLAPFYQNSNQLAELAIIELVKTAEKSIKIAAQHVCPIEYNIDAEFTSEKQSSYTNHNVILNALLEQAAKGVRIEIISQTFADGNSGADKEFHTPGNPKAFVEFYTRIKGIPNISYFVNDSLHSKYIITDDEHVLISTFNYTPSQFIYLDNVQINTPSITYKGIFSECGMYAIITDPGSVSAFTSNFKEVVERKNTVKIQ